MGESLDIIAQGSNSNIFGNLTRYFRYLPVLGSLALCLPTLACNGKNPNIISPTQIESSVSPALNLISPNGDETLEIGSSYNARWASRDVPEDLSLDLRLVDSSNAKTKLATSPNDGNEQFTVPNVSTGFYKLEIGTTMDTKVLPDQSDNSFRIVAPGINPISLVETIAAVGDIGWDNSSGVISRAREVGMLIDRIPGRLLTLGDHAYPNGTIGDFMRFYDPFFGRHKGRTSPTLGNHDVMDSGAGFFRYFGPSAPMNYYSFNLGAWHIISLDSNESQLGSQVEWLRDDLNRNKRDCTLAFWHHPPFSSGQNGDNPRIGALWRLLYEHNADVILCGHDHLYERFAPQDANGRLDLTRGIRQFTVGTGGAPLYRFVTTKPNSEIRENQTYGVLRMTLRQNSYDWEFIPIDGQSFRDFGVGQCH